MPSPGWKESNAALNRHPARISLQKRWKPQQENNCLQQKIGCWEAENGYLRYPFSYPQLAWERLWHTPLVANICNAKPRPGRFPSAGPARANYKSPLGHTGILSRNACLTNSLYVLCLRRCLSQPFPSVPRYRELVKIRREEPLVYSPQLLFWSLKE